MLSINCLVCFLSIGSTRFQKKLPGTAPDVTLPEILLAMLRLRGDTGNNDPASTFHKLLVRLVHTFSQAAEQQLEKSLLERCPDPTIEARIHPFLSSSRRRGNRALEMAMVSRFVARGAGYVSTKDMNLSELGVVGAHSTLGSRTSSEFCCRILQKTAEHMESCVEHSKTLNIAIDAAMVSEEHVSCLLVLSFGCC